MPGVVTRDTEHATIRKMAYRQGTSPNRVVVKSGGPDRFEIEFMAVVLVEGNVLDDCFLH